MKRLSMLWIIAGVIFIQNPAYAKRKVTFLADDGVTITADLYFKEARLPYVVLFHQDGCSRGEYNEIAEKIMNLNYNCLAVDLRCGDQVNYVENETARYAKNYGYKCTYNTSEHDVRAALQYAYKKSEQPVILFGSAFSASLCLKVALNDARISAVVAFDPGEYLKPEYTLKEHMKDIDKPVFIAANKANLPYVKKMFLDTEISHLTYFTPSNGKGERGSKALWEKSANNKEYWLALLMFFSKL